MADEPRPLPAGTVLRFGSLDFVATGNGYDMELLPAEANPDTLTPPPQHRRRSASVRDKHAWSGTERHALLPPRG
jgi:hypothetical protein